MTLDSNKGVEKYLKKFLKNKVKMRKDLVLSFLMGGLLSVNSYSNNGFGILGETGLQEKGRRRS